MKNELKVNVIGNVTIKDKNTNEILMEKKNAVHAVNLAEAIALSLANRSKGHIFGMSFGNGGSVISSVGTITYLRPNVIGDDASLYNQTYTKIVDDFSPRNSNPTNNNLRVFHNEGESYSDIMVTCTLDYNEPSGQDAFDDTTNTESMYVFDELGLRSFDADAPDGFGKLLSHVIFSPIQKSLNRQIEVEYVLRIIID